ncbi:receptor-like cytosolic serine/threonine-protein kinase RBK1 isoform X2 [Salvia hispanica]|uniref:receptor-like cytosolic serine/threonine-protein kinase RBK1 isoform X2 n=1 Tax=Salvia hispanica TaxID=49212 RepID=UPI002009D61A|nr:receptor-like cytosolic serine/threonine-protein kinase RBK1 isoform X2 [Salvia hispanica]
MKIEECKNIPRKQRKKKNLEKQRSKTEDETESPASGAKLGETDEETSPRGVLDMVSRLDEKSGELSSLQWKKMFGQVKKTSSVWKISTISLLGGGNGMSKKAQRRRAQGRRSNSEDAGDFIMPKPSWRNFSYEELRHATHGFSSDKMIGKGGHAEVYKGMLHDGQVVAVKKIMKGEKNDEGKNGDFLAELGIIAHIDHPNAAKLIGFSADQGLYLVLQYSPHGSLATSLHGSEDCHLDWGTRYKVAIGVAKGLQYLHSSCQRRIIHRDITASNILLSEDYEAQISDFGLAKWLPEGWAHLVVTPIEGTFGYMAPEYFMHRLVNEKTDVFAFGVLLLELITGRRAVDSSSQSLVMWAKPHLENSSVEEIADPRLGGNYDVVEMKRAMFTASTCIHHQPTLRPNMMRVVQLLKGDNGLDMKQKSMGERVQMLQGDDYVEDMKLMSIGGRTLHIDACDAEDYDSPAYLTDLNRHMQLVME